LLIASTGMVKSDLGRAYKTSYLLSLGVDLFSNLAMKTTEGGARTLVLATMTTPGENGKYYTNYQSDEDYKLYVHISLSPSQLCETCCAETPCSPCCQLNEWCRARPFLHPLVSFSLRLIILQGCSTQYTRTRRTKDAGRSLEGGFGNSGGEIP
jgi:hypothetical protein